MNGSDKRSGELFSYVDLEDRVPAAHPLRLIRRIVKEVLAALDGEFTKLYADGGRPSIAPERLLRALLLQVFYTIRSERQLMEQPAVPLVCRARRRRAGVGADGFHKEPGTAVPGGSGAQVPGRAVEPQRGARAAVERTLCGRRHAGSSLVDEELPGQGRLGRTAVGRAASVTSTVRRAATIRTLRPPIRRLGSIARAKAKRPSSLISAMR
jgi:hypothetical protein